MHAHVWDDMIYTTLPVAVTSWVNSISCPRWHYSPPDRVGLANNNKICSLYIAFYAKTYRANKSYSYSHLTAVLLQGAWCWAPAGKQEGISSLLFDLMYVINNNKSHWSFWLLPFSFLRGIRAKRSNRWQILKPRGEEHTASAMKFMRLIC